MVGAITTLIVVVAVFLAYNANNGLPFVPTYRVSVDVPNASRLVRNNEVRIGGNRVGVVESIDAVTQRPDQRRSASRSATARARSTRHLRRPGRRRRRPAQPEARRERRADSRRTRSSGSATSPPSASSTWRSPAGTVPAAPEGFTFDGTNDNDDPDDDDDADPLARRGRPRTTAPTTAPSSTRPSSTTSATPSTSATRNAGRQNLIGFGDALAGRGASLNLAIEALNPLLTNLKPVAEALDRAGHAASPRFFPELGDVGPDRRPGRRPSRPSCSRNMAITFGAIGADPAEAAGDDLRAARRRCRPGSTCCPPSRPSWPSSPSSSQRLKPGVRQLRLALPDLNERDPRSAPRCCAARRA